MPERSGSFPATHLAALNDCQHAPNFIATPEKKLNGEKRPLFQHTCVFGFPERSGTFPATHSGSTNGMSAWSTTPGAAV